MTGKQTLWGGTQAEAADLLKALARHCACGCAADGVRRSSCPSHALLLDQRSMDQLLFARTACGVRSTWSPPDRTGSSVCHIGNTRALAAVQSGDVATGEKRTSSG